METRIIITFLDSYMDVPYKADHKNGRTNFGFINLKDNPEKAKEIFETTRDGKDRVFQNVLTDINEEGTEFFTIGCERSFNHHQEYGYWTKGYIQFAINERSAITLKENYERLFENFKNFYYKLWTAPEQLPVEFNWEIEAALFQLPKNKEIVQGFTASVWFQTAFCETEETSKEIWETSIRILADYLCSIEVKASAINYECIY